MKSADTAIAASLEPGARKRGSGVKHVYDILREEILSLHIAPGSGIDEVKLAERFGMSRTPIREALVRLAGDGLIETLPNRSTIVSPLDLLNLSPYFDALVLMYRATTRLAARQCREEDLVAIRAEQARFAASVQAQDALEMIATNAAFHLAIAAAGRNPYFTGLFQRLLDEGRRILRLYYRSYDDRLPQHLVDEHETMIEAIANRDPEEGDRLAQAHGEQIVDQIGRLLAGGQRLELTLHS